MVPRKQAGHMTCTRPQAERQILLAMRASSTHDTTPACVKDFGTSSLRGPAAEAHILRKNTNRLEIVSIKPIRCDSLYLISSPQKLSLAFGRENASHPRDRVHCNAANFAHHGSRI